MSELRKISLGDKGNKICESSQLAAMQEGLLTRRMSNAHASCSSGAAPANQRPGNSNALQGWGAGVQLQASWAVIGIYCTQYVSGRSTNVNVIWK